MKFCRRALEGRGAPGRTAVYNQEGRVEGDRRAGNGRGLHQETGTLMKGIERGARIV